MKNGFVVALLSGVLMGTPVIAGPRTPDSLINPQQVAAALSSLSVVVSASQIALPSAVSLRRANADIEVSSFFPLDPEHSKVKLRCRDNADCLPFYAVVTWHDAHEPARIQQMWAAKAPVTGIAMPSDRAPLLVRTGDPAKLVLEGKNILIQLPVICLGSGAAGARVRVTTSDRKHIYRAVVAGPGLLKSGL
jgi:hypothetical protein